MYRISTLAAIAALATTSVISSQAFAQPGHGYHVGDHVEKGDWGRGQRIDYHAYKLRAPPRGYEWRRVDNNYILAAVATGAIASVIAASR
jgi:Ni/Co efflux regulator RcnB